MRSSSYFKTISRILIFAMLHLCWLTSYSYAEMVPTESANQSQYQDDRQRILDLLDRQEVVEELGKYGISKVEAVARINSLTDEEITVIAGKLDELPPGGYGGFIVGLMFVGMAVGYVFFWFPALILFCPFSDKSYGECISDYSRRYWGILKEGGGSGYADTGSGLDYCTSECESDFEGCIESAEGDKSEEQECKDDKNTCDTKCADWSLGFQGDDRSIWSKLFGGGGGVYERDSFKEKTAADDLDQQVCRFDCNEALKTCFDSINKGEDTTTGTLRCKESKNTCFQQCESNYEDGDPKDEEYISPPKAEEDCVWQFDSCMKWTGSPQQEKQCNIDKQMCLNFPCNKNYSSCLKKVGKAISSEQYCVEEKQKCISKMIGK